MEFLAAAEVFRHYVLISNEVNSPKVLTCPSDRSRQRTKSFATFSNSNLSYFVGLDAVETAPQMRLSGDRNITTNGRAFSGILTLTSDMPVSWTKEIHNRSGNIGLADGSVEQVSETPREQPRRSEIFSERLLIPY